LIRNLVENGRASSLLKASSKRKRTREELEEVKQEEDALKDDRHAFLQEMRRLKQEHADMAEELQMIHLQQQVRIEAEQAEAEIGQQRNFII
jgi:hypothetical protein